MASETKKAFYHRRRDQARAGALAGTLEPSAWNICAYCGECFPFFSSYFQNPETKTCPEWLTGKDCGKQYRQQKSNASNKPKQVYYERKKSGACRRELCSAKPYCIHISRCLDLEIKKKGSMPLKRDGSCKVPNDGAERSRCHGISYGDGPAYSV